MDLWTIDRQLQRELELRQSLSNSVALNRIDVLRQALRDGADVSAVLTPSGRTALHECARFNRLEMAREFLKHGAKVDVRDTNQRTPLFHAAAQGFLEVATLLLDHGASVEERDENLRTPLCQAAMMGHCDMVELLLEYGASAQTKDKLGWDPVLYAGWRDSPEMMVALLERGGSFESRDPAGRTVLHLSTREDAANVRAFLLKLEGIPINAQDDLQNTPLHLAAHWNLAAAAKELLTEGANTEMRNEPGLTPLQLASWRNSIDVARLLVDFGADINAKDEYGRTPLHYAAQYNAFSTVKLLVEEAGADINSTTSYGLAPLDLALGDNHDEIAEYLRSRMDQAGSENSLEEKLPGILDHSVNFDDPRKQKLAKLNSEREVAHRRQERTLTTATLCIVGASGLRSTRFAGRKLPLCRWALVGSDNDHGVSSIEVAKGETKPGAPGTYEVDWSDESFALRTSQFGGSQSKATLSLERCMLLFTVKTPTFLSAIHETVASGAFALRELDRSSPPGSRAELSVPLRWKGEDAGVLLFEILY